MYGTPGRVDEMNLPVKNPLEVVPKRSGLIIYRKGRR